MALVLCNYMYFGCLNYKKCKILQLGSHPCIKIQYGVIQYGVIQYGVIQYDVIQYGAMHTFFVFVHILNIHIQNETDPSSDYIMYISYH